MSNCEVGKITTVKGRCSKVLGPDWITSKYNPVTGVSNCRKAQCSGSAYKCCTTGSDKNSCNGAYSNLTAECNPHMIDFCSQELLFTNPRCITWAKQNSAVASAHMANVCNDPSSVSSTGKLHPGCVKWCVNNPGKCDVTMVKHCAADYDSPECKCINNKIYETIPLYTTECYDKSCKRGGYMTAAMRQIAASGKCPDVMSCSAGVNIDKAAVGNILDNVTIEQNCLLEDSYDKVTTTTNVTDGKSTTTTNTELSQATKDSLNTTPKDPYATVITDDSGSVSATGDVEVSTNYYSAAVIFLIFVAFVFLIVISVFVYKRAVSKVK